MDVLVDLDGTLVDPAAGIIASFRSGLAHVGIAAPPAPDLAWVIGPPLRRSFPMAGVGEHAVEAALAAYRTTYRGGAMFDATPYPGVDGALSALTAAGHRLFVATSKPHAFARPIIDHFGLARHFTGVYGPELDGTLDDKADLVAHIVSRERLDPRRAVMLGDRKYDCLGAGRSGIPTIGVLWGYGSRAELTEAGAVAFAGAWEEIPGLVMARAG